MTSRRQRLQLLQHSNTNLYSSHNFTEAFYDSGFSGFELLLVQIIKIIEDK